MSYSEAITRNDLMGILDNIVYAKDDWTVPNITKNKAGNTEYTTTGGSPKTIMSISHHTNTGRFVILSRAVIKTSRYTSNATLYVDGNYVDSTGYNTTNLTTPVTVNPCAVFTGERDKTYTIELKIDAQDSGTTVTAPGYNPAQLIAIDILSTQSKGSRILECYPVGSYYETSDSNFNPNTEWGGTWVKMAHNTLLTSLTYRPNGNTTDIGNITIPEDGYYLFIVGWSNGKPLFAGLSTDTQNSPTQVIYDGTDSGGEYNVVMYMTAGVNKVWVRAQSASANNTFYVYKVNYLNDNVNRWHRTA